MIEELNELYGFEGRLEFVESNNELIKGVVTTDHCAGEFYLNGGHVTHFQPVNEKPMLFMSAASDFESGKAIRGGIPICFPWFGPHASDTSKPSHGYARLNQWRIVETCATPESLSVELATEITPFDLRYLIEFGKALKVSLMVRNDSDEHVECEVALHTYFSVSSIDNVTITGLENASYFDKLKPGECSATEKPTGEPTGEPIKIASEVDRVYQNTESAIKVHDSGYERVIVTEKTGSQSTVVWNPWIEKAKRMSDFGDNEYPQMLCVETANITPNAIQLSPNQTVTTSCTHSISRA